MTSSDACTAIRVAVLGDWVPAQLADLLALQRAEEPQTVAELVECGKSDPVGALPGDQFDFAVAASDPKWPGWICEPLWHDTLAVGLAKRSHLLVHREVPCGALMKQRVISARSCAAEPWYDVVRRLFEEVPRAHDQVVSGFCVAMTLVAAGYGVILAPATRLARYQCQGIAVRPLAGAPTIVVAYLVRPAAAMTEPKERLAQRAHSVS